MSDEATIVFLDIETAPTMAWVWKRWKENISQDQVVSESFIMCLCWKILGDSTVRSVAVPDFDPDGKDDRKVVLAAHRLLDAADIVVAHNAKGFDIPTLNARFMYYGMSPPSPYKVVDTLDVAKKGFRFGSNKLDSLCAVLFDERKKPHHFDLWAGCLANEPAAWRRMVSYCKQDVALLERLYLRMRPWIVNHPNVRLLIDDVRRPTCPKCGGARLQKRGYAHTQVGRYPRYQCMDCGGWTRGRYTTMHKDERRNVLANVVD